MNTAQLLRLSRLVGHEQFQAAFGSPEGVGDLGPAQERQLAALIDKRLDAIVETLVAEAAASDDVVDSRSASGFAADRLAELSDLLTETQRGAILLRFENLTAGWDSE